MGPVAVGTAGSAGQVGPCTLGKVRGARKAVVVSPKREEHGAQKARVVRVVWHARWVVCTRVDVGENDRVAQQAGVAAGEVGTRRARVDHEEEGSWRRVPGRGEGNAAASVGAGRSLDMAHDGQTLVVGCGAADGVVDGEEVAESGNGALDGHRGERVDDEDDVAVGVAVVVVVDDYEVTVVVAPVAELVVVVAAAAAAVLAAVAVYALRAPQRENFEGGQLRS